MYPLPGRHHGRIRFTLVIFCSFPKAPREAIECITLGFDVVTIASLQLLLFLGQLSFELLLPLATPNFLLFLHRCTWKDTQTHCRTA